MFLKIIDFLHCCVDKDYIKYRDRKFYNKLYARFRKMIGCPGPYVVDDVPWIQYINTVNLDVFYRGCAYLCASIISKCYRIPYATAEALFSDCDNYAVFMRPKSRDEWKDENYVAEKIRHLIASYLVFREQTFVSNSGVKMTLITDILYAYYVLNYYKKHIEEK